VPHLVINRQEKEEQHHHERVAYVFIVDF